MYKVLNFFNIFTKNYCLYIPLNIKKFKEIKYVSTDISYPLTYFLNKNNNAILIEYYDKNKKIGFIRYYSNTGQIGSFFIDAEYQNRGLGKQILSKVIKELESNNCKEVWAVTSKNHPFWVNVYNKSFSCRDPEHPKANNDKYFMYLRK